MRAAGPLLRDNANVAAQYLDWLGRGDVASVDEIQPGAGAIVRQGAKLLAVYRDHTGICHARAAACIHLGGVVTWNPGEKTWDCHVMGRDTAPWVGCSMGPPRTIWRRLTCKWIEGASGDSQAGQDKCEGIGCMLT